MSLPLDNRRLLVAEDEYLLAWHLCQMLEADGATVIGPVASVADALRMVADTPELDGAVLDVNLGGGMVYPVADALRARGIPFVLATGYDVDVIPETYRDAPCVQKPVDAALVAGMLGTVATIAAMAASDIAQPASHPQGAG